MKDNNFNIMQKTEKLHDTIQCAYIDIQTARTMMAKYQNEKSPMFHTNYTSNIIKHIIKMLIQTGCTTLKKLYNEMTEIGETFKEIQKSVAKKKELPYIPENTYTQLKNIVLKIDDDEQDDETINKYIFKAVRLREKTIDLYNACSLANEATDDFVITPQDLAELDTITSLYANNLMAIFNNMDYHNQTEILDKIEPDTVIDYLEDNDWQIIPRKNPGIKMYTKTINEKPQFITIPTDRTFTDYYAALFDAMKIIAEIENKFINEILTDFAFSKFKSKIPEFKKTNRN